MSSGPPPPPPGGYDPTQQDAYFPSAYPLNGQDPLYAYQPSSQAASSSAYPQTSPVQSHSSAALSPTRSMSLAGMLNDGSRAAMIDPSLQDPSSQFDPSLVDPSILASSPSSSHLHQQHQQQAWYPPQPTLHLQHPHHQQQHVQQQQEMYQQQQQQHLPLASPSSYNPYQQQQLPPPLPPPAGSSFSNQHHHQQMSPSYYDPQHQPQSNFPPPPPPNQQYQQQPHPSSAPSPSASMSSRTGGGYYDHDPHQGQGLVDGGGEQPWMENYSGWEQGGPSSSRQPSEMDVDGDEHEGEEDGTAASTTTKKGGAGKKGRAPAKPREKKPRAPAKPRASKAPPTAPTALDSSEPPSKPNKRSRVTKEAEKIAEKARRADESDLEGEGNQGLWRDAVGGYKLERRERRGVVERWGVGEEMSLHSLTLSLASQTHLSRLAAIDSRILTEQTAHQTYLQAEQDHLARQKDRLENPAKYRRPKQPKSHSQHRSNGKGHGLSSFPMGHYEKGGRGDAIDELEGLLDGEGDGFESGEERGGKRRRMDGEGEGGIGELEDELLGRGKGGASGKGVGKGNWKRPPKPVLTAEELRKGKGRANGENGSHSPFPYNSNSQSLPPGTPSQYNLNPDSYDLDPTSVSGRSSPTASTHSRAPTGPEAEERRVRMIEEAQAKIWSNIVKRDVPRVYRVVVDGFVQKRKEQKKISLVVQREGRRAAVRATKASKNDQLRSKKMMREMLMFWKRNEKDERDNRKKAEKEALDKAKKEEEERESKRQSRKLNFLITQTELYSHFVGSKIKTAEAEESEDTAGSGLPSLPPIPSAALEELAAAEADLKELDFNEDNDANLNAHARKNAQAAVAAAKAKADAFDVTAAEERKTNEALAKSKANGVSSGPMDLDSDELNFQNPTMAGDVSVKQPKMLTAQLKDYQLKGLNWLANLYEQGINGILADEMGLGKTIQSISLMAYLAEVHDIWGPFLVIAPASTLHNWQQEITRFVPQLKCLPYWGNVKDRATLRKFWNRKQISYNQDAPFHVLITSYQLVVSDEKYFQRVKWQYMILDEAQAIKSSTSARWKTLLGFHCRNRLLLTGTPVQNSMHELWALLHFIMPSLFDSHDEFSEWFSRDIENAAADNKGSNLNEHQLRRLHMILKPFMLRRVKKNVQNELGDKIEIDVYVNLSPRQKNLYQSLRSRISIAELMDRASNTDDQDSVRSLMNLVMQFRKVCNHPQLFERVDVKAPFAFSDFARTPSLSRQGDLLYCPDSSHNPIELQVPKLLYEDGGLVSVPGEGSSAGSETFWLKNMMNVWSVDWLAESLSKSNSSFSAFTLFGSSPSEARREVKQSSLQGLLSLKVEREELTRTGPYINDSDFAICTNTPTSIDPRVAPLSFGTLKGEELGLPPLTDISRSSWDHSYLSRRDARFILPKVVAPPITSFSTSTGYATDEKSLSTNTLAERAFFGLAPSERNNENALAAVDEMLPGLPPAGLVGVSRSDQLPQPSMQMPEMKRLIFDSAKLARLDLLLRELKKGGHRVLLYFQMTKMIDLIEEYLVYRQYKYLRLDGNSKISDRRDMVTSWQTDPEIFVFCLSTRAGGLGINLTAADTVIFYDNDWNPSNDAQAMDRAHRLGQTRQVTVYRLITKGTIDERIVKLARQKKEVQDLVVGNKTVGDVAQTNEVLSLLLDDDELAESLARRKQAEEEAAAAPQGPSLPASRKRQPKAAPVKTETVRDLWKDVDEDDFFGASKPVAVEEEEDEDIDASTMTAKKPKAKAATGAKRKPRGPNKRKKDDDF